MQFIIVTGMSGSGKSCAMDVLEDIGFYCIDNIPPQLLTKFADICMHSDGKLDRVAVAVDIRSGDLFGEIFDRWKALKEIDGLDIKILYLEANDEVIIKRYKETRRKHPLDDKFSTVLSLLKENSLALYAKRLTTTWRLPISPPHSSKKRYARSSSKITATQ